MPGRVKQALLLAAGLHGILILGGQYQLGYDAYNHMFFADHYLHNWWMLWDPRWYTGFWVNSYPPLVHQLNALLGFAIGIDAGYKLLLWLVLSAYPFAAYRYSRVFLGERGASYAALGAALLPSVYLAGHTFGQLPTLTAALLALFAASVLYEYLLKGDFLSGSLVAGLMACVMAAHHATLLFLPGLLAPVCLRLFTRKKGGIIQILLRLGLVGAASALAMLVVIWPFWDWGRFQTIQTPIDHLSRHNFFADPFAFVIFFLPVYGLFILMLPGALWLGRHRRLLGLALVFTVYFIFGLGGTTPLPRLALGPGWAWLTYDRFAFWASLILLPLVGDWAAVSLRLKKPAQRPVIVRPIVVVPGLVAAVILVGFIPTWLQTQPKQLDLQPVVDFLAAGDHSAYRYLTFGFGDQMAYLSRQTQAATLDGSYHTARSLPELRSSGLAQIDIAIWTAGGLAALKPVLDMAGERGVRWGFVNHEAYTPVLQQQGWNKITTLANGVAVWENPGAVLPAQVPPPLEGPWKQFSWGFFPLLAAGISAGLAFKRAWPAKSQVVFGALQAAATGLLPMALSLWYFRTLAANPQPRIYFTYSDTLFFLSDGVALAIVLLWLLQRKTMNLRPVLIQRPGYQLWVFSLCGLASISVLWTLDWRTSLYVSLHLWLCWALFVVFAATERSWVWFGLGSSAALAVQTFVSVWQTAAQTTAMTLPLGLNWPGSLEPIQKGASVVVLENGAHWLRAYGLFPHPNILGGFGLVFTGSVMAIFLIRRRWSSLAWILILGGLVVEVISFSRSAWLGLAAMAVGVCLHWKKIELKRAVFLAVSAVCLLAAISAWLYPLFYTRILSGSSTKPVETEQVSNYTRLWLVDKAFVLIEKNPLLGSGVGTFPLALSQSVARFYDIEPVHNIFLLLASELGLGGLLLFSLLGLTTARAVWTAHTPEAAIFASLLLGLFVVSLFDHYFWTLTPGRTMFFAVMGIAAGQVSKGSFL